MTWGDLVLFVALESMFRPESPAFQANGMMPLEYNNKRVKAMDNFPILKAYCQRVEEHPEVQKFLEERPGHDQVAF